MKTYIFENLFGIVAEVKADTMKQAEETFKKENPTKTYSMVYEK